MRPHRALTALTALHPPLRARAAGGDERCKGLLALLSDKQRIGVAQLQELRGAVADFK